MLGRLWDAQAGAFLLNAGNPRKNHSQDAQVQAILAGVTDAERTRRALRFINTKLLKRYGVANGQFNNDPYMSNYISPFISSTELLARLKHRDTAGALRLIRRTWGRVIDKGPGTVWERRALDGTPANYAALQASTPPFGDNGAGGAVELHARQQGLQADEGGGCGLRRAPKLTAAAKLSQSFDDVLVGPQKDGQFPSTHSGVKVSSLPASARKDVTRLITAYVGDVPSAISKPLIGRYEEQYSRTYISYAGGTTDAPGTYLRIDGPQAWIEFAVQKSDKGSSHYHSVYRDKRHDYGA